MTHADVVRLVEQAQLELRWTAEEGGTLLAECPPEPTWAYVAVRLPISAFAEVRQSSSGCAFLAEPLRHRVLGFLDDRARALRVALAPEHQMAGWVSADAALFGFDGFSHTYVAYFAVPTHSEAQRWDAREAERRALLDAPNTGVV